MQYDDVLWFFPGNAPSSVELPAAEAAKKEIAHPAGPAHSSSKTRTGPMTGARRQTRLQERSADVSHARR